MLSIYFGEFRTHTTLKTLLDSTYCLFTFWSLHLLLFQYGYADLKDLEVTMSVANFLANITTLHKI